MRQSDGAVHATPELPQIQHVVRTNYCDLGFELE
jgi:N-acetyl-gamma-glutamyl-phosphate reductase